VTSLNPTAARPAGRSRPAIVSHAPVILLTLFAAGALISAFSIRNGIDPFDEGLMLQAARRITLGQVPYRDFLWAYGPAQPYLLALLFKVFGVSLLHWRIIRVLADAGIALTAYVLVAERASRPVALGVWLAVACEISEPRSADPFPLALLGCLLALHVATRGAPTPRRALGAAALTGVAAAFRLDFALYGLAAVTVTFAFAGHLRIAITYVLAVAALIVLVYLPFVILDGPGALYHALIGNSLHTRDYWTLPFPVHYHAPAGAGFAKAVKKGLDFYIPLLVVIGYGVAVAATVIVWWRDRRPPAPLLGLSVMGVGLFAYLFSRADEFHVQPLSVVVAIALGMVIARVPRPAAAAVAGLLALLLLHGVANRGSAIVHPPAASPLHVPVADGVEAPPAEAAAIDRMVRIVDALVPPGRPIYVVPRRADLVRFDDPLIYVLTERDNPTPEDFGLLTGAAAQATIVSELARTRPRVIVRWTDPESSSREPNLRGRSSGVHTLDRWIAAHYRLDARLYHYEVLVASTGLAARPRT
jgi:hypothetical protein